MPWPTRRLARRSRSGSCRGILSGGGVASIFFSCLDARKEAKENQGPTGAGEVWPGTRQTWLASLTPLDARGPTEAGEVWPGIRQTWLASLTPLDARGPTGAGEVWPDTCLGVSPSCIRLFSLEREIPRHTGCDGGSAGKMKKLFGIYFGGYSENISGDFVSSFEEHSRLCDEKDGTKGRK